MGGGDVRALGADDPGRAVRVPEGWCGRSRRGRDGPRDPERVHRSAAGTVHRCPFQARRALDQLSGPCSFNRGDDGRRWDEWFACSSGGAGRLFLVTDGVQKPAMAALVSVWARNLRELAAANVAWSMIDYIGFLTGSLLVGIAVATIGLASAFATCILPFVLAGVLLAGMTRDVPEPPLVVPGALGDAPADGSELLAGVRTILRHPELRLLVGGFGSTCSCRRWSTC